MSSTTLLGISITDTSERALVIFTARGVIINKVTEFSPALPYVSMSNQDYTCFIESLQKSTFFN